MPYGGGSIPTIRATAPAIVGPEKSGGPLPKVWQRGKPPDYSEGLLLDNDLKLS